MQMGVPLGPWHLRVPQSRSHCPDFTEFKAVIYQPLTTFGNLKDSYK